MRTIALIYTDHNNCRKCYACVRACPVKTISINKGLPEIIEDGCLGCGQCVLACSIGAKVVSDDSSKVKQWLLEGQRISTLVAPSYPASFDMSPGQFVATLRSIGFTSLHEVAYGAGICASEYTRIFNQANPSKPLISTACPAVVQLVEKHFPLLIDCLVPIDSPMLIQAKIVKAMYPDHKLVFIGPCLSKKHESEDNNNNGYIDAVLTFRQLENWLTEEKIMLAEGQISSWDNPQPKLARTFPISGGLLKTASIEEDVASMDIVVVEGARRCIEVLKSIDSGEFSPKFVDMLVCEGCVMGPGMVSDKPYVVRAQRVAATVRDNSNSNCAEQLQEILKNLSFERNFTPRPMVKKDFSEEYIWQMLKETGKNTPRDLINCSACGYDTCWEKAVACLRGLAEKEMCLPFLLQQVPSLTSSLMDMSNKLMLSMESINFSTLTLKGTTNKINLKNKHLEGLINETNVIARDTLELADKVLVMLSEAGSGGMNGQWGLASSDAEQIKLIATQVKQQADRTNKAFEDISLVLHCLKEDSVAIFEQEKAIKVVTNSLEQIVATYDQLLNIGAAMASIGRNYA